MAFKLRSPIPRSYFYKRSICLVTQFFGDNKNYKIKDKKTGRFVRVYGDRGHLAIDFKTSYRFKYLYSKLKGFIARDITHKRGEIPCLASHSGFMSVGHNDDSREGIYMKIMSKELKEGDRTVQYETLYFHLSELRTWVGDKKVTSYEKKYGEAYVRAGSVIGRTGNTGRYTTGPHLHFELRKRVKNGRSWGKRVKIDPIPYFKDNVTYQKGLVGWITRYKNGIKF